MKKNDLKKAYGKATQSFHNKIVSVLDNLEEVQTTSLHINRRRILKTVIACALILATCTVGVVTAKAIYPMVTEREGNYGLNIEFEPISGDHVEMSELNDSAASKINEMNLKLNASKNAPEYVKVNIGYLPDGVIEYQGKYSLNGNSEEKCFTFCNDRIVEKKTITEPDIVDYEEFEINGNRAVLAKTLIEDFSRRFYIYFENEATFVMAYVTNDVPDDEIKKVMENITVEECTAEETNTSSLTQAKEALKEEKEMNFWENIYEKFEQEYVCEYSPVELGQKISYKTGSELKGLEITFDKIEILDNISGLDYNKFEQYIAEKELPEFTDENGNLIPHEREHYVYGDGITSPTNQLTYTDTITSKMVYITLTVNNPTSGGKTFAFQGFSINFLDHVLAVQNGEKTEIDVENSYSQNASPCYLTEVNYVDKNNVDEAGYSHGFNFLDVAANSTKTIHIGFFVDEDEVDEAYVVLNESWCDSAMFDPKTSSFVDNDKKNYNNVVCIKVR